jgi:hypothetical protein
MAASSGGADRSSGCAGCSSPDSPSPSPMDCVAAGCGSCWCCWSGREPSPGLTWPVLVTGPRRASRHGVEPVGSSDATCGRPAQVASLRPWRAGRAR